MRHPVSSPICPAVPAGALLLLLAALAAPLRAQTQQPGDHPRLTLQDPVTQAPPASGPFDSTGVLQVSGGSPLTVRLSYLSPGGDHDMVPWALLLSPSVTGAPLTQIPPPLYTAPPFLVLFPPGLFLGPDGQASFFSLLPAELTAGTAYFQAIVRDLDAFPALKLSNGVQLDLSPPRFNAAFSFARAAAGLDEGLLDGVGTRDLGVNQLNTLPPFGAGEPPAPTPEGLFPPGFSFLPLVPTNIESGPVLPLARPTTLVAQPINAQFTAEIVVDDTTGFPEEGELLVQWGPENPWGNKGAQVNSPNVEVIGYSGKTPTSFTGLTRAKLGSEGNIQGNFPHAAGEIVIGDFTMATTDGIFTRDRIGLDARNPDVPRITLPPITFVPDNDGGGPKGDPEGELPGGAEDAEGDPEPVTRRYDLLRYRVDDTGVEGFALLDTLTHSFELIEGTEFSNQDGLAWDPVVTIAPDNRSFLAALRVNTGIAPTFASDPDRVFAIRMDGLSWPASGEPVWEITYDPGSEPGNNDNSVRGRRLISRSFAIVNTEPEQFVAYMGLAYEFRRTYGGEVVQGGGAVLGYESAYAREEVLVRDLIEVPLVPPGSSTLPPAEPRPRITTDFPNLGDQVTPVRRFDPEFLKSPNGRVLAIAAGSDFRTEDIFVLRNVTVQPDGSVTRSIQNISRYGAPGGSGESTSEIRAVRGNNGAGSSGRMAFSPEGTRLAWLEFQNARREWLHVGRVNGQDAGNISDIYKNQVGSSSNFQEPGPFGDDHAILQLHWLDEEHLIYFMGVTSSFDPLVIFTDFAPATDLFMYDVIEDQMTNLTQSGGGGQFDTMGTIQPLASWPSDDGKYLYVLRNGPIQPGNTVLPPGTEVTNLLAFDRETLEFIDITGDEYSDAAGIPNLFLDEPQFEPVFEVPPRFNFLRGRGIQADRYWFTGVPRSDETDTEQLFTFRRSTPTFGFQATDSGMPGSRVSDVTPSPSSGKVAYARTATADRFAADQHPIVVDLDNFLFERDLVPDAMMMGMPTGRVMPGSLHFVPRTAEASEALAFVFGTDATSLGIAVNSGAFLAPLRNISNPALLPEPLVLPLLSDTGLGADARLYLTSVGASADATPVN